MSLLAGNWKLYKTTQEVEAFFTALKGFKIAGKNSCAVAPSPALMDCAVRAKRASDSPVKIYSQNIAYKTEGALTGEVGVKQLLDLGVEGTLVAHSERRQFFGETDATAAERSKIALDNNLDVLFCIGENLEERRHGKFNAVIETQLASLLKTLASYDRSTVEKKIVIAYEPVWAIGTGVTASIQEIAESHLYIHNHCVKSGYNLSILYGGSVKPDNFAEMLRTPHVFGGLVGGASLDPQSYRALADCLTQS